MRYLSPAAEFAWPFTGSGRLRNAPGLYQFEAVAGVMKTRQGSDGRTQPSVSSLEPEALAEFYGFLARHTAHEAPAFALFDLTHGYRSSDFEGFPSETPWGSESLVSQGREDTRFVQGPLSRSYLAASSSIADLANHVDIGPPAYLWPEGRAWCLFTDVDLYGTYVLGSSALVESFLQEPGWTAERVPRQGPWAAFESLNRDALDPVAHSLD